MIVCQCSFLMKNFQIICVDNIMTFPCKCVQGFYDILTKLHNNTFLKAKKTSSLKVFINLSTSLYLL